MPLWFAFQTLSLRTQPRHGWTPLLGPPGQWFGTLFPPVLALQSAPPLVGLLPLPSRLRGTQLALHLGSFCELASCGPSLGLRPQCLVGSCPGLPPRGCSGPTLLSLTVVDFPRTLAGPAPQVPCLCSCLALLDDPSPRASESFSIDLWASLPSLVFDGFHSCWAVVTVLHSPFLRFLGCLFRHHPGL